MSSIKELRMFVPVPKCWLTPPLLIMALFGGIFGCTKESTNKVHVVESTYGWNCKDFKVPAPAQNLVTRGNFTKAVAEACNGKEDCLFTIDVTKIGDPAGTCGKDFEVTWACGTGGEQITRVGGEANGKNFRLACPG